MSVYVVLNLLNESSENFKNEALPSFYRFQMTSLINLIQHKHEIKILFMT
jgi:hypothetical protein